MKNEVPRTLKILNILAWIAVVAVNVLAVRLPLNGVTPADVSDAYPNLFAPAAITFSIWGVIYTLLLVFVLYGSGVFGSIRMGAADAVRRVGPLFALSSVFNIAWIFCWHYDRIALSVVCMAGLLICLAAAFTRICRTPLPAVEQLFVKLPFGVYFGWITVAAIANVTVFLVSAEWDGFGLSPVLWTAALLVIGVALGLSVILKYRATGYGLAMVWAYAGIVIEHVSPEGWDGAYPPIIWIASICAAALLAASVGVRFLPAKDE